MGFNLFLLRVRLARCLYTFYMCPVTFSKRIPFAIQFALAVTPVRFGFRWFRTVANMITWHVELLNKINFSFFSRSCVFESGHVPAKHCLKPGSKLDGLRLHTFLDQGYVCQKQPKHFLIKILPL